VWVGTGIERRQNIVKLSPGVNVKGITGRSYRCDDENISKFDMQEKLVYKHSGGDTMPAWIFIVFVLIGSLAVLKLLLAISIISVLPVTQGAMFHPSARIRVKAFLDHVPMTGKELLVDIGCGDGRVLREARRRYGVQALGIEVNPLIYLLARIRNMGVKGVRVQRRNFWKMNLGNADVVFCYLFPDVMTNLAEKLAAELRPGTRVISCNFPLPGWNHTAVVRPDSSLHGDPIYFYRFPCPLMKADSRTFDVNISAHCL